jgi:hypothetical protein
VGRRRVDADATGRSTGMASILDMVRGALGPDVIERVGGLIGENTTVTRRALDSAVARPRHS